MRGTRPGKRDKCKRWGEDEKRIICAQARFTGVSVSQVARRYDVNANQSDNGKR
ncbi:MAG: transposase [Alphaproteobacteria bacterium]|nr:transposase [Alphaproteobacteria bacterium]